ncbi:MAG: JAB domain-containing protein [Clostridiales bacterium]|nr:JAB domain-containing protein [Clostridiales bacterium]
MKYEYQKYKLEIVREQTFESEQSYFIKNSEDIFKYLTDICRLHKNPNEVFLAIAINAKGEIIGFTTVSVGDLCSTTTHPREVYKFAICCNAGSVVFAHNHPSEDPVPSDTDIQTTKRLSEAGKLLGIPVLDHLLVGNETSYISMKREDLF